MQPSGLRPSPTDAAAETGRWATSHRDVAAPEGEPSWCAAKSLRKAKSRLPLWGRWTRVSEDGEGELPAAPSHGLCGSAGGLPSQSRLPPCQLPQRGSQVCAPPKACAKPSLASPFGGGGLALARTERASCQRPPRMGCVEALAGCPLSHGCRRASSPEGGAKLVHNQKFAESQVSPPPLGGAGAQWAPFSA